MLKTALLLCSFATMLVAQTPPVRGPAICRVSATGATVQWTTGAATVGAVAFGTTPSLGNTTAATASAALHEVDLPSLQPSTRYYYRVLAGGQPITPVHAFTTMPTPAHPFVRIAAFGDSGVGTTEQAAVARLTGELEPDLVAIAGDVNYPDGAAATLDAHYFAPYAALLPSVPFFMALGNHDYRTACGQPHVDGFCLPSSVSGGERWYSIDVGNVHIAFADSEQAAALGSSACATLTQLITQLQWLDADLAASTAQWKIVVLHHPPRSYALHGDNSAVQAAFEPILEARGVDLLLCGHDHCYERFPRMVGGVADPRGPRHLVVGTGGAPSYTINPGPLLEFGASTYGVTLLDVSGNQLRIRFVGAATSNYGQVLDDVTMTKGPVTPTLARSAATVGLGGSFRLDVRGEAGQPWLLAGTAWPGYQPVPPFGVLLLDPGRVFTLAAGSLGTGPATTTLTIPTLPQAVGADLRFQAGAGSTDPRVAGFWLTNTVEVAVR